MSQAEQASRRKPLARRFRIPPRLRRALLRARRHPFAPSAPSVIVAALLVAGVRLLFHRHESDLRANGAEPSTAQIESAPMFDEPPERELPPEALYGTSDERCIALGDRSEDVRSGTAAERQLWQPNSRAMCYMGSPVCLYGTRLEKVLSFAPRGSGRCEVMSVKTGMTRRMESAEMDGDSCARFRQRRITSMFGEQEVFYAAGFEEFRATNGSIKLPHRRHYHAIEWHDDTSAATAGEQEAADAHSSLSIVIPKYDWSWNICHYNRIWQYVVHVIRNLHLFVPDTSSVKSISITFRAKYPYNNAWATGIREATLPALERLTGLKISVDKARYSRHRDFLCWHRAIFLGQEGRVDAYPFLNDTDVWSKRNQIFDDHMPSIPHDSLWLRSVTYETFGLHPVGNTTERALDGSIGGNVTFTSIPVPPLVVAHVLRSAWSKRRFSSASRHWFDTTLRATAEEYGIAVREVRFNKNMKLAQQASIMRDVGLAVGVHGANFVNTIFMPPAAALFEIFPWRYVRYYYAGGANSGLRYSFHEVAQGHDHHCSASPSCFFKYREAQMDLSADDQKTVSLRLHRAMKYLRDVNEAFPTGHIPLVRSGNSYSIPQEPYLAVANRPRDPATNNPALLDVKT
jgi:hypothetical protein